MACGGLANSELNDKSTAKKHGNSSICLLKVAFEMKKFVQPLTYGKEDKNLILRIGIHYGPVIAGVIGHHKPQFSLIGDTINTTSRLCSTGRDGKIVLSDKAYQQVKDYPNLLFFERRVEAKGKGELITYEVKQIDKINQKRLSRSRESPIQEMQKNLGKLQIENNEIKKLRLFEEILQKSESPSDIMSSMSNDPPKLTKSLSHHIHLSNLFLKPKETKLTKINSEKFVENIDKTNIVNKKPQLKLNVKEGKSCNVPPMTCILPRNILTNSPIAKPFPRTPDASPKKEMTKFSFLIANSDSDRQNKKPECIKEEDESSSPEMYNISKKLQLTERPETITETFEFEENYPGEYTFKRNKSNSSFETIEEEEDVEAQELNKNVDKESTNLEGKEDILSFSKIMLRILNDNQCSVLQNFYESLFYENFQNFKGFNDKSLMIVIIAYQIFDFLVLSVLRFPLKMWTLEIFLLKCALICGFSIILKFYTNSNKFYYFKKIFWILFVLLLISQKLTVYELNLMHIFKEINTFFVVFTFSQFSLISFSETFAFVILSSMIYILQIFPEETSFSRMIFLILSYVIILFNSHRKCLSKMKKFNYNLINNQKKIQQENLLMHLLPNHLFKKFMLNPASKSELIDEFEDVTMLFADIKGFTEFSAKRSPEEVVNMLRDLFTEFDKLCLKNKVYKLYTIGDCYVVLGMIDGENRNSPEEEAKNIIFMAFSMIDAIKLVRKKINYNGLDMRIGIHTGKIIGGIIGTDIVRYDIYGRDVLIANKMESNGKEGHIMVSSQTKNLLEINYGNIFFFEYYKDVVIPSLRSKISGYFVYPNTSIF